MYPSGYWHASDTDNRSTVAEKQLLTANTRRNRRYLMTENEESRRLIEGARRGVVECRKQLNMRPTFAKPKEILRESITKLERSREILDILTRRVERKPNASYKNPSTRSGLWQSNEMPVSAE